MKFSTLYKKTATGAIQQWDIHVEQKGAGWIYVVEYGQKGGAIQRTESSVISIGKNLGKSNETSPYEQCVSEAEGKWTKQRDRKGYTETIPDEVPYLPMLAKTFDDQKHHIVYPCYVQPKFDGICCITVNKQLFSRQGKQFKCLQHIEDELVKLNVDLLHGELYSHNLTFQEIVSAVKRDEASPLTSKIQYRIYDLMVDKDYDNRLKDINKIESNLIKPVETHLVQNEAEIEKWWKHYTDLGYEGVMLRNLKGTYENNRRSKNLQKYKKFIDEEFIITGANECKGKFEGMCTFLCETKTGAKFDVMPEGTEEERRQYLVDWKSGKIKSGDLLTVKFFSWTNSENKVPRFPVGKSIRNYE